MTEDLICPIPEPERFDRRMLNAGIEIESYDHIKWNLEKEHYDRFNSVPKERRQRILDRFHRGGITIGKLALEEGLEANVISSIIFLNIKAVHLLNNESL